MESEATTSLMQEDGYSEYITQPRKRKKKSKVWKELVEGAGIATCRHCKIDLVATTSSGTSHLKRHLDRCPQRPIGFRVEEMESDDEENFVFNMNELRKEIVLYIVEGAHSFATVEEKGFRRMMSKANPNFIPFSRSTAKREMLAMYVSDRDKVKDMLLKAPGRICLTTDNWKSNHTWQHYICITAHFVDSAWKLHKRILRFRALAPPYDGESIANEVFMFLTQWNIVHKILTITVDNATYNDVMASNLKKRLVPRSGLISSGAVFHVRCCAHIINLIVQKGLKVIAGTLEKIRNLVKLIIKSSHRSKEFFECAEKIFHLDVKRKLNLDMQVRWNSTYKMLDNALYYKSVFVYLMSTDSPLKSYVPLEEEWEKLNIIHKFLKLFYDVTCMFSAVKSPTSNLYFKGAWMVHRRLLETAKGPHDFLAEMANEMLGKFDKYWSEYNLQLSCAAILDPRFKVKFVEYCFSKVFGFDEAMEKVETVLSTLRSLYNEYKLQSSTSPTVSSPAVVTGSGDDYFDDYHSFRGRNSRPQSGRSHLDLYLEEPGYDLNSELDVLDFWHKSSVRYPDLSVMARDLLTIPVSTVASESAFSLGGKTISPTRSALKPKTVQALVCLQDWRRADYGGTMEIDYDSNSGGEEELLEDEEDDTSLFF